MFDKSQIISTTKLPRGIKGKLIPYYQCSCKNKTCGNITYRDAYSLNKWSGNCRPCANRIKLVKARSVPNPADGKPYEALYHNLLKQAKRRDYNVSLTFEEFCDFTNILECHYCESKITWSIRNLTKNGSKLNLDRMDNSKGYSKENCVVCCWRCNNGKGSSFSYKEWLGMTKFLRGGQCEV